MLKNNNPFFRWSFALICVALSYPAQKAQVPSGKPSQPTIIRPSSILQDIVNHSKRQANITPSDLATYANKLLEEKGFNYQFDVCEVIGSARLQRLSARPSSTITYSHLMEQTDGQKITLTFTSADPGNAPCGECFSSIPSLQVNKHNMLVVSKGRRYQMKRPALFGLDEAELVDATMKKVLRTWQLPYQTTPIGISADGTKLYLDFYNEELDVLIIELSEDGRIQFKARRDVELQREGEQIEGHPTDPKNDYLSFMRFHVGGKKYIVKFSYPCT